MDSSVHLLQFFTPVTSMDFILRLRQRFWLYSSFLIFFKILLIDFLFITKLSQISSRITQPLIR